MGYPLAAGVEVVSKNLPALVINVYRRLCGKGRRSESVPWEGSPLAAAFSCAAKIVDLENRLFTAYRVLNRALDNKLRDVIRQKWAAALLDNNDDDSPISHILRTMLAYAAALKPNLQAAKEELLGALGKPLHEYLARRTFARELAMEKRVKELHLVLRDMSPDLLHHWSHVQRPTFPMPGVPVCVGGVILGSDGLTALEQGRHIYPLLKAAVIFRVSLSQFMARIFSGITTKWRLPPLFWERVAEDARALFAGLQKDRRDETDLDMLAPLFVAGAELSVELLADLSETLVNRFLVVLVTAFLYHCRSDIRILVPFGRIASSDVGRRVYRPF
jgi:hypothetical protein